MSAPSSRSGRSGPHEAAALDVYTEPGVHNYNGRQWRTACQPYSSTVERCRTEIWATTVTYSAGRYTEKKTWVFNNLTYKPSPAPSGRTTSSRSLASTPGTADAGAPNATPRGPGATRVAPPSSPPSTPGRAPATPHGRPGCSTTS
ncbi:hypothetical protein G7085_12585 [Tessaracoccus sp. HDW20]|uniref:hypothetical protein n=1 Tax=Tessaracoccus coleopterorum TaxID=2714950 RepID=UPI0018D44E73|nr:hypothetical protein [Tessaracoccus coleopterorum]NHB85177.1 hypothetical protein [Tessaracoccus coleopterorum]